MLVLRGGGVPLAIRTWPDTPEEALARVIAIAILAGVVALGAWWLWWWFNTNRPNACRRHLEKESAEFRANWPQGQLGRAPYRELDKEAQRCWLMLLLLEQQKFNTSDIEDASKDIVAVRHWIDSVVAASNEAAARDRQASAAGDFG